MSIARMMHRPDSRSSLIIGIGSGHGADSFGWDVIEVLRDQPPLFRCRLEFCSSPALMPPLLLASERSIVVDAMLGSQEVLRWISIGEIPIFTRIGSLHGMGICEAIGLSCRLGLAEDSVRVLCLEVSDPQQKVSAAQIQNAATSVRNMISCPW